MHEFYSKIELNQPIDTVFKFFNSPKNLEQLMPPFMGFSLLTPGELVMQQGAVFDYMVTVFGLPNRWTTYISEYNLAPDGAVHCIFLSDHLIPGQIFGYNSCDLNTSSLSSSVVCRSSNPLNAGCPM